MVISSANTSSLDWVSLSGSIDAAYTWIKSLLTRGQAVCLLQPTAEQEQQLWHFFWEQRTARRLRGQQELYFTYPSFVRAGEKPVQAQALLRWPCQLEPPISARNSWLLKVDTEQPAQYNMAWAVWATSKNPNDWNTLLSNCLTPSTDGLAQLNLLAQTLSEQLGCTMDTLQPALTDGSRSLADEVPASPDAQLQWSARLQLSVDNWEQLYELPKHWREPLTYEDSVLDNLSLAALNPQQYQAFRQIHSQRYVLVEGRQGTGKSHSILELLKLSLAAGKRCLVVAAERNSLLQLQTALEKKQLAELCFLWQNEGGDLPILQGLVNSFEKQHTAAPAYDELQWRTSLAKINRSQRQLDEGYQASRQRIFGEESWFTVLGYYLAAAKTEEKALLSGQLQARHFEFNPQEHTSIVAAIANTRPLYEKLGTMHHPLQNLSAAIFVHQAQAESRTFIIENTDKYLAQARSLLHRFVQQQSQYADALSTHHETHYLLLRTQLQKLEEQLEDSQNAFGADTLRSGDRTLKLYGQFSDKYRQALSERSRLAELYENLQELHEQRSIFSFEWPTQKINKLLPQLPSRLLEYRKELENWRSGLSGQLQEEMVRLNHKTALVELPTSATIQPLEEALEIFVDELNGSGLYQLPIQAKTLTLARQQKRLEEIIDQLERTRDGLVQYEDFYTWQRNWFSLSERARKSIQALLRARPANWEAAFSSWYFNECLQQQYAPFPILADDADQHYREESIRLRQQLPEVIRKDWDKRRRQAQQTLKNSSQNWPTSLTELMERRGTAVAKFHPVALANPRLASFLAPHYDLVILENAGSLTSDNTAGTISQAAQLVAFANPTQVGDQYRELVTLLRKGDIPRVSYPYPEIAALPTHWNKPDTEVFVHQLDGLFDATTNTNEVEALDILQQLNNIQQTPQKTYPSVGVIALTIEQRDRILQLFYRIKRERSPGAELIQQLERNGLQVLFGNDAIAQQFDVLLVSTVYGPVDHQGHLSEQLAELNEEHALAGLSILESVLGESKTVHFLNSLPLDELRERLNWNDRPGERYLAQMLLLAQAQATEDYATANEFAQCWEQQAPDAQSANALHHELLERLSVGLPSWTWAVGVPKGIRQACVIATAPTGEQTVLLTDGFVNQDRFTTHDWESWQREKLGIEGYRLLTFSSEQLWKNTSRTCRRIVEQLAAKPTNEEEE